MTDLPEPDLICGQVAGYSADAVRAIVTQRDATIARLRRGPVPNPLEWAGALVQTIGSRLGLLAGGDLPSELLPRVDSLANDAGRWRHLLWMSGADKAGVDAGMDAGMAAVRDAERYRWLRARPHADVAAIWLVGRGAVATTPEQFDVAIDAGRAAVGRKS